ncbi:MAG: prohibitin family protein [Nitrospirae bacterium]|nr:prohibitin family protein [Nitrospirota bacterium]
MVRAGKFKTLLNRIMDCLKDHIPQMLVTLILITLLFAFLWNRIVISIQPGEAGVLYKRFSGGTVVDKVFGEGLHLIFPWNTMTVYDVRYNIVKYSMTAITKHGLDIQLDVAIRYRPEYDLLAVLHQAVGTDYVNKIVKPEVESALITVVGEYNSDDAYSNKRVMLQSIVGQSLRQVSRRFVRIDSVMITKITLPEQMQKAILVKLEQEQINLAYNYKIEIEKKEAIIKKTRAGGITAYNDMINASLNESILRYEGITATREIAQSPNAKIVVIGAGKSGLPVILDTGK